MTHSDLSVVIPAFNASRHIARAIGSAREVRAHNIIVVDDGSADDTADIARDLGCQVISQVNSGAAVARQVGVEAVTTATTILLDADDSLVQAGVEESLRVAAASSNSWALIAGATLSAMTGRTSTISPWPEGISLRSLLDRGHSAGPPGAFLWRTSSLRRAIGDDPPALRPRYAEDYELLIRGTILGDVICHRAITCIYASGGGKSALAPLQSNASAEDIRRFYADAFNLKIRERSINELHSMAYLRLAYAAPDKSYEKLSLYVRAALKTPSLFPGLVLRKLRRVVAG